MYSSEDLRARFQLHPTEKLILLLENAADYTPAALETAEVELRSRGVPEGRVQEALQKGTTEQSAAQLLAEDPLPNNWKWAYFLGAPLAFSPVLFFLVAYWSRRGYTRRSRESLNYVGFGWIFWSLIALLLWQLGVWHWPFDQELVGGIPV